MPKLQWTENFVHLSQKLCLNFCKLGVYASVQWEFNVAGVTDIPQKSRIFCVQSGF